MLERKDLAIVAVLGGLVAAGWVVLSKSAAVQIAKLEPVTARMLSALLEWAAAQGIKVKVGETLRSTQKQLEAVESGASAVSLGWHQSGRAADLLVWDDQRNRWDEAGLREDLWRRLHRKWAELGGQGLAYLPYPDGPPRFIKTSKGQTRDTGHVEYHGPFATASAAFLDYQKRTGVA